MSNAAEQIFFYGQVTDPAHASSFDVLTYLDLTNGGTILFQAIILITIIICFLPDLAPLTLTGVQRFIISPIRSLLHDIHWAVQQLSNGESRKSFYRLCYANAQDTILNSSLVQLTFIGILWFFPSNRPLSTAGRLWALAAGSKWMYISALIPGHHYLNGITAGFSPMGRDRYEDCLADMARSGLPDRWTNKQWLASYRCSGVETGLELYETIKDRAQWLVPPVDSEVRHLRVLAFMAVLIPTLVIGLWLFYALCNKVAALRRGMVLAANGEPRPTECEAYLWNLSKSLETANGKLQQCMATREAEFQAEKQRLEETVRHQTDLTSRKIQSALRQAKDAHAGIIDELKRKVVQLENNLTMARAEAQFVVVDEVDAAREQFLKDRIVQLEKQLAGAKKKSNARSKKELQTVKDELQTRTDELTTLTDKLSEAETRVSAAEERGRRSETQLQELIMKNQELLAQNQQISAESEAFQVAHEASLKQSLSLETMQKERDAAIAKNQELLTQNQNIIAEYEAFRASHEANPQHSHGASAQQSMQEGEVACNLSVAEARAQAEQARSQAFMMQKNLDEVTEENRTLQIQIGLAMRDAQRGQERADTAERVNKVLEVRLAQWEEKARDEQMILKRPTANVGSVTTALQQCQVKVSEQQTRINELTEKLEKAKVASPAGKVEEKLRADLSMIKSMYDREKRARTEDQIRWSKENRELEEELRKLRISISNAKTQRPRRSRVAAGVASDACDID
ncbi:uncharacterized protein BO66DRAFT_379937 [Aspergillus aculeatinus CBS 121060]|uniref:Uncharacterized protein n=1 Tax=Aspergillus aculeatinus CBS 121060 TaxID=1448322 RepID=A0ACD1H0Y6_9EURO|nr:hypothetical protein BO66DRAFT_379937 [Aspergillus aculeatinus CBS 121060]RAH67237.1 hypothetical protein BO66DRAFT_379937 [Aspergillus aculeatinus CBS 121060]